MPKVSDQRQSEPGRAVHLVMNRGVEVDFSSPASVDELKAITSMMVSPSARPPR